MSYQKIGFIGGGRVTRIILGGWKRKNALTGEILVLETNPEAAAKLKAEFPEIRLVKDLSEFKDCEIMFLSLHPPVMAQTLADLKAVIDSKMLICSLAPKMPMAKIAEILGGHNKIIRMNPNAPSMVNAGFNPVVFSEGVSAAEKQAFLGLMTLLGKCPETKEINIESFAVISAMGPTYLLFQLFELVSQAQSFGLTKEEAVEAVAAMSSGSAELIRHTEIPAETAMDLVPVRPMADDEGAIKEMIRNRTNAIYQKLRS